MSDQEELTLGRLLIPTTVNSGLTRPLATFFLIVGQVAQHCLEHTE